MPREEGDLLQIVQLLTIVWRLNFALQQEGGAVAVEDEDAAYLEFIWDTTLGENWRQHRDRVMLSVTE